MEFMVRIFCWDTCAFELDFFVWFFTSAELFLLGEFLLVFDNK